MSWVVWVVWVMWAVADAVNNPTLIYGSPGTGPAIGDEVSDIVESWALAVVVGVGFAVAMFEMIPYLNCLIWSVQDEVTRTQGCFYNECPMGRLVADMALAWCSPACHVAFFDGAQINGSLPAGTITAFQLNALLPTGSASFVHLICFSNRLLSRDGARRVGCGRCN
jgi:hypothetical protein